MDPFYRNADGEYLPVEYDSDTDDEPEMHMAKTPYLSFSYNIRYLRHRRLLLARCIAFASLLLILAYFHSMKSAPQPVDWARFAYVQYATSVNYLCNAIMLFESLHRLGSKADRILVYSPSLRYHTAANRLLDDASKQYGVKVETFTQAMSSADTNVRWDNSLIRFLSFNQTNYERVICLDSDATVLQSMDELFFLPKATVIAPQSYWDPAGQRRFSIPLLVIQPSVLELSRVELAINQGISGLEDIDIIHSLYGEDALVLPHRPTILMSAELKAKGHAAYLGSYEELWDPKQVYSDARYFHFSDANMYKPWVNSNYENIHNAIPSCDGEDIPGRQKNCDGRDLWLYSYADFAKRRRDVCGFGLTEPSNKMVDENKLINKYGEDNNISNYTTTLEQNIRKINRVDQGSMGGFQTWSQA